MSDFKVLEKTENPLSEMERFGLTGIDILPVLVVESL